MIESLYAPFIDWSKAGNILICSDTHFDDPDRYFIDKDWPDAEEHLARLNENMGKCDTFVHLGDVGDPEYIKQIKSKHKVLIMGNHDKGATTYKPYFDEIYKGPLFISPKILLSHEPIYLPYVLNIHGHIHNELFATNLAKNCLNINVASDVYEYRTLNLKTLIKFGYLSYVKDIHRYNIDNKVENNEN